MNPAAILFAVVVAMYVPFCATAVRPTIAPSTAEQQIAELWSPSMDVGSADTFNGPWGPRFAPDPKATFKFVHPKTHGVSPGMTVRDPEGTEWSIKQGPEGPIEVTFSRVLSALGYHQPPVYYLGSLAVDRGSWVERAPGGRFRPHLKSFKETGEWSWQENPFVGTRPYQGLLVVFMLFNGSDLKNSNNSIYELKDAREGATRWFVVRDIGTALGETGRLDPKRGDADLFARLGFIKGVRNGFVQFPYHGLHQELVRDRITVDDVRWACALLARLTDRQWQDAFRAGGFARDAADRFIRRLKEKIQEGQRLS